MNIQAFGNAAEQWYAQTWTHHQNGQEYPGFSLPKDWRGGVNG